MNERYVRNINSLTEEENRLLKDFKVCVIGCGGLGGHVIEQLGRLGIGYITAVDADVFESSNLNRQIFSDEHVLGKPKALVVKEKMNKINSEIIVNPIYGRFTKDNADEIISGHHIAVDALDNISSRKLLADVCSKHGLPLVHGAIAGWYGQVSSLLPGSKLFNILYPASLESADKGMEVITGNPAFTPAIVASLEVSEVLKLLLNKGEPLTDKLLTINLLDNRYDIIDFDFSDSTDN